MTQRCRVAMNNIAALLAVSILTVMSMVLVMPEAQAHDSVIKSVPTDGGHVDEFPRTIEMTFSGIPKETYNTVAITHEQTGTVVYSGEPELENQQVRIAIPEGTETPDGNYIVGFQITSSDGHSTRGKIGFSVGDEVVVTADEPDTETESSNMPFIIAAGIGFAVIAIGAIIFLSRKEQSND
ncbi:copper resistance CopC family protein [Corynebacterium ulceribovis]|uniref:copper resistance CopC family protein n=1 Tax=Corynebacterium ulceribovis TaxID=487732 RepID=UPI0003A9CEE9|nr:copper resistance protein CopC [Corynebacterium ulceribovis]